MDLSVKNTQLQRDAATPAANQSALLEGTRNAFAAVLQKAAGSFSGNASIPFAPEVMKARIDRPAQTEQPDRAPRGDNRVRAQDNDRPAERTSKPSDTSSRRTDTRSTNTSRSQRAKEPEKAAPNHDDTANVRNTDTTAPKDVTEAPTADASAPAKVAKKEDGANENPLAVLALVPQVITEVVTKIALQISTDNGDQSKVLIGKSGDDAPKQGNAPIAIAAPIAAAAVAGGALKQNNAAAADDDELNMTMIGPEAAVSESETDASMFQIHLQAASHKQNGATKGSAKLTDTARDQASNLSQLIGDDKKMTVKVSASAMSSLPQSTATLVPAAALMGTGFQTSATFGDNPANGNGQANAAQNSASGQVVNNANTNPDGMPGSLTAQGQRTENAAGPQSFANVLKAAAVGAIEGAGATQAGGTAANAAANEGTPQTTAGQLPGQATSTKQTGFAQQAQAAHPNVTPQQVAEQVKVSIGKAVVDGTSEIKILLKPESLGHIEVKLELSANNQVHAIITADRPETLDMLKQDARGLEKSLQDAGLKTDSGSLSFNLRGDHGQQAREGNTNGGGNYRQNNARTENNQFEDQGETARAVSQSWAALRGGVDVRI